MLTTEDMVLEEEELVFKYELEQEGRREGGSNQGVLSDEYLEALPVGERQEDELLRLAQKEERYIIIREDHTDFIMDLIRCGEQFSYESPLQSGFDDDESENSEEDDDVDDTCPGANTSHLAQEYLLEVLAIKFREQVCRRFAQLPTDGANHDVLIVLNDSSRMHTKRRYSTRSQCRLNCFKTSSQTSRQVRNRPAAVGRRKTKRKRSAARKRLLHSGRPKK